MANPPPQTDTQAYAGSQTQFSGGSELNATAYLVKQILAGQVQTMSLVQVLAVHGGGVGMPATVDVQVCVNQVDGNGTATPHGPIYGVQCWRMQGGLSAAIIDPIVGDIGVAVFSSRDISSVVANRAIANPGSARKFDFADAVYFGAVLGLAPTQFVQVSPANVTVTHPIEMIVNSPMLVVNGLITATGNVTAGYGGSDQVDMQAHVHGGVTPGAGVTGAPVAGS